MSATGEPVPRPDITTISPRLASAYANKTSRTVTRDLNSLIKLGLVTRTPEGYAAHISAILGFLPPSAEPMTDSLEGEDEQPTAVSLSRTEASQHTKTSHSELLDTTPPG